MKINKEIEFETLHSNKHRIYLLCGIVCVVVLMVTLIITTSKAKYKTTQSLPLINGTINYDLSDLNLIGAYIQEGEEYKQVNEIPLSGYEFNSDESYCTVNNERDDTITLSFDMTTQNLTVTPLTKKGTKCYLYFDEKTSGSEYILASSNAPTSHTTDWTGEESYYYTGTNPDNWVSFAGFYWRIIRINGNGSIRMIYAGTNYSSTNDDTLGNSAFNSNPYNKTYVGLVYDGSAQHGSGQNSTIMNALNTWYNDNLTSYETNYIDTGTGFCSDRNMASDYDFNSSGTIYYASYDRQNREGLQCYIEDILSQDNGKLSNPIGLLTSDEYVSAGSGNSYLGVGIDYWTMSPYCFNGSIAFVYYVGSDGRLLGNGNVSNSHAIRPVINLRSDIQITGSGTTTDPFQVVGA